MAFFSLLVSLAIFVRFFPESLRSFQGLRLQLGVPSNQLVVSLLITTTVSYLFAVVWELNEVYAFRLFQREMARRKELLDKMVKSSLDRKRLLSVLGHDLIGPISSAKAYLELNSLAGPPETHRWVGLMSSRLDGVLRLLQNVLDWSRRQWVDWKIQKVEFQLETVVLCLFEQFEEEASRKGVRLEMHFDPPFLISADVDMITIIPRNLISNALKFTSRGGRVNVKAAWQGGSCG